jgi:predicted ATP-binding protein involved in virulence
MNPEPSMVLVPASSGSLKMEFINVPDISRQLVVLNNSLSNLPEITVTILLGAIVIAGISAFIRSRVAVRNVISQN